MLRRKYYKKLFLIYFSFALVYGMILTAYFVYQNKGNLESQQIDHHLTITEQTVKNLDQRLWSLDKYTDTLFLDDEFNDYIITDEDYYVITQVHDKLRTDMAVFTDMGARIAVTKMDDDMVITNQYTRNLEMFYEEMNFDSAMIDEIENYYQVQGNYRETLILHDDIYQNIHIVNKRKINSKDYLVLMLSIDKGMLQLVSGTTNFEFTFEDREDALGEIAKDVLSDDLGYEIKNDQFYIARKSSVYPEMQYIVYVPYVESSIAVQDYAIAVALFIGLSLLGLFVATFVSRNLYKPIEQVVDRFDHSETSPTDEFAYLDKMTTDIISANEILKTTIEENQFDLRTKFIREMLYGLKNDLTLSSGIQDYSLQDFEHPSRVVLIQLEELETYRQDYSSETRAQVRNAVQMILNTTLALEPYKYELIELHYNAYALIVSQMKKIELKEMLVRLLKAVEANEQVDLVMAIGKEVEACKFLEASYNEAQAVLDYKPTYDKRAIVSMADVIDQDTEEKFNYTFEVERDLYNATINGSVEKINVLFQRIYKLNFEERQLSSREQVNLMMGLMTTLRRVEQKMPGQAQVLHDDFKALMIDGNLVGKELLSEIESTFEAYAKLALEKSASKDDEISTMMVGYIEEHYHEDISLEEAATYLNISAGYFCTVFKKQTGTSFKSFLNSYRVTKAKEILKVEPNMKIKDLTLRVGYNNVNSFIRMFKKSEGVSPGEYARRIQS